MGIFFGLYSEFGEIRRSAINDKPQKTNDFYYFGAFRLDVTGHRLWRDDELIPLTPKQFELLTYFVENAGSIAKKSDLLDAVWADAYIEESTLARNVSWLRSKLEEEASGKSFIETVPKLGYRFTAEVTSFAVDQNTPISEEQTVQYTHSQADDEFDDGAIEENDKQDDGVEEWGNPKLSTQNVLSPRRSSFNFAILFNILIICVALAGSGYILSRTPPETGGQTSANTGAQTSAVHVIATITIKNIAVDATQQAVDAGIKVLPGDSIMVGAEGQYQPGTGQTWTFEGDKKAKVSSNHIFQRADPGSLVGWIGTTEADQTNYFQVSKGGPVTSNESGFLYFAVNDRQQEYADNRGELSVTITLTRTFDISAEENDVQTAWGDGLVMLYKEDMLAITASGTVSYWPGGELYDTNGSHHKTDGLLAPTINTRSLIGKIGSRNPFKVGLNYPQQKVVANGWLFISVNDQITGKSGAFKNNRGNISVGIEVVRSPEGFTNPI